MVVSLSQVPPEEPKEEMVEEVAPRPLTPPPPLQEPKEPEQEYELYTKEVVKHRGGTWLRNTEQLPEGWTILNHHCGFPLFFQKETRIVTWARPYYIGNSSVKNHKVPMAAIPCLAYSRRNDDQSTDQFTDGPDTGTNAAGMEVDATGLNPSVPGKDETGAVTESVDSAKENTGNGTETGTGKCPFGIGTKTPEIAEQGSKEDSNENTSPTTDDTNGLKSAPTSKMCPLTAVDAKMIRADKNLIESQKLREYIKLKFEYDEVQGKVIIKIERDLGPQFKHRVHK